MPIPGPPSPSALALDDAKEFLNLATDASDVELQTFIDAAEAVIEERVGALQPKDRTDRVPGGGTALALFSTPAVSLTSVTEVGGSALTVGDLSLNGRAGVVRFTHGGTFTGREYDVVYSAGRETCPPDLLMAVKFLVKHMWESQRGAASAGSPFEDQQLASTPGAGYLIPYRVLELIAPHLQPGLA